MTGPDYRRRHLLLIARLARARLAHIPLYLGSGVSSLCQWLTELVVHGKLRGRAARITIHVAYKLSRISRKLMLLARRIAGLPP